MARGVNKVILVGYLGADPEVRYMSNGGAVTNVSIATTESWKDKQSGQKVDRTEWHRVVFYNKLAEIVGEYLKKGSQIYIEGRLRTRKWQNKDKVDQYTTEVIAVEMQMLGSSNGAPKSANPEANNPAPSQQAQQPQNQLGPPIDDFDDDIPF